MHRPHRPPAACALEKTQPASDLCWSLQEPGGPPSKGWGQTDPPSVLGEKCIHGPLPGSQQRLGCPLQMALWLSEFRKVP